MSVHDERLTIDGKTYVIHLEQDQDCMSPLEYEEDVTITYLRGARSSIGTEAISEERQRAIALRILATNDPSIAPAYKFAAALAEDDVEMEEIGEPLIGLAVYSDDYGSHGWRVRVDAWDGDWDSRPPDGFIYVTRKTVLDWQGGKRITKAKIERVRKSLRAVIEEYERWCNGECYGYTLHEITDDEDGEETETELEDSCWGFIGYEYALEEARSAVKAHHEWAQKKESTKEKHDGHEHEAHAQ
mgnify:CR=1 FL=1